MPEVKFVGRGVDTFVLNISYADKQFQPIKQNWMMTCKRT